MGQILQAQVSLFSWVRKGISICWGFLRYDFSATVAPFFFLALASWHTPAGQTRDLDEVIRSSLLYSVLYALIITISGQAQGVEEDRIEKPDRPIPSGMITVKGAWLLWRIVLVMYLAVSLFQGVFHWTLLWVVTVFVHNLLGGARHWIIKNASMSLGTIALLGASWQIVSPLTEEVLRYWVLYLPTAMFLLYSLQDLRDIDGDVASGRRTFPYVYGLEVSRAFLGIGFIGLALAIHVGPMHGALTNAYLAADLMSAIPAGYVAWRLLFLPGNKKTDHRTYMWFTYWFCFVLAAAIPAL